MGNVITAISVNVGAGATADFQPGAKEAWEVNIVGSNKAFVGDVPDVEVSLKKGASTAIMLIDPSTDPGHAGRMHKFLVNNTVYLSVKNTGAAGANISIVGKQISPSNVLSDVLPIGAGATIHVDPGLNYSMIVYELGTSAYTAGPADVNPAIDVFQDDGALDTAIIWDSTMIFGHDKFLMIPVTNALQLNIKDKDGGGLNVAYSAEKVRNVRFIYDTILSGADLDIVPPAGSSWLITCIAASILAGVGGPPTRYPDVKAMILIGANESNLMEAGSVSPSLLWDSPYSIAIDNTKKLRIHNINAAPIDVCVSGFLT